MGITKKGTNPDEYSLKILYNNTGIIDKQEYFINSKKKTERYVFTPKREKIKANRYVYKGGIQEVYPLFISNGSEYPRPSAIEAAILPYSPPR